MRQPRLPLRPLRREDHFRATTFQTDPRLEVRHLLNRADRLGLGDLALEELEAAAAPTPIAEAIILRALLEAC